VVVEEVARRPAGKNIRFALALGLFLRPDLIEKAPFSISSR
jgi:hypothetical protein